MAAFSWLYMPRMHRAGYVAPNLGDVAPQASPGGYVMDSRPVLYDSVLVLDYKSLYPSIIRTFLIDPIGLIEGLAAGESPDTLAGFAGARFSRRHHVDQLWQGCERAKRDHNAPLSQAMKIIMNAFYGVSGAPRLNNSPSHNSGWVIISGSRKVTAASRNSTPAHSAHGCAGEGCSLRES